MRRTSRAVESHESHVGPMCRVRRLWSGLPPKRGGRRMPTYSWLYGCVCLHARCMRVLGTASAQCRGWRQPHTATSTSLRASCRACTSAQACMHLAGSSHCDGMERVCAAWMQRLELLITLLLARGRLPSTDEADSAQCQPAHLAAAVAGLPSGLLAFIGEAIIALDSQLSADGVRKKIFAKMFAEFKLRRRKEQLEVCTHLSPCAGRAQMLRISAAFCPVPRVRRAARPGCAGQAFKAVRGT